MSSNNDTVWKKEVLKGLLRILFKKYQHHKNITHFHGHFKRDSRGKDVTCLKFAPPLCITCSFSLWIYIFTGTTPVGFIMPTARFWQTGGKQNTCFQTERFCLLLPTTFWSQLFTATVFILNSRTP